MAQPLEFWFEFASTYSYLAAARIEGACAAAGVEVRWQPFLLGPLFSEQLGIRDSPFNVRPERGRYMWRDVERLCAKHAVPWKKPSVFPRGSVLASRVACAGEGRPWVPAFVRAVYLANFAEDRDIADREVIRSICAAAGALDAFESAEAPETKARLRAAVDRARALGIFGAPNFFAGGEHFFGQDRLDDAIAWARRD